MPIREMSNVGQERYCPRLDVWLATWGRRDGPELTCAECGAEVLYNPTPGEGAVRLVCLDCLHTSKDG